MVKERPHPAAQHRLTDMNGHRVTAARLLLTKYSDPVAAALGGLILYRLGRLAERQEWVENLSRDFGWLRDGQILCAAFLSRDEEK